MINNIKDIVLRVTKFCPGDCLNCNISKQDPKIGDEIDLDCYENLLKTLIDKPRYFSLTGGESQLSPKYEKIVELISIYNSKSTIQTNISGWYPNVHLKQALNLLKFFSLEQIRIDISVDGTREYYEKVRFVKNGWDKLMKTTQQLQELGLKLTYVMIVYKENFHCLKEFVDMCKELNVNYYIGFPMEGGNYSNEDSVKKFTQEELSKLERLLESIGYFNTKHKVNWEWFRRAQIGEDITFDCFMGQEAITVDANGDILPCLGAHDGFRNLLMGSLKDFEGDLNSLLASEKSKDVINHIKNKMCQPCCYFCIHKAQFPWGKGTGKQ